MPTVKEVAALLEEKVPTALKMDFDNVGLLVGLTGREVTSTVLALDITDAVIREAVANKSELIVSHHPLILDPLKNITDEDLTGRKITELLTHSISAICLHTNLDSVSGGVNDALADAIGARVLEVIEPTGVSPDGKPAGIGRICELPEPTGMLDFLFAVRMRLGVSGLRYHDAGRPVHRITICSGSGGDFVYEAAKNGSDTVLVGEMKYHQWLDGRELGLNILEADHFCTENVVIPVLRKMLKDAYPTMEVRISTAHSQTALGI